MNSLKPKRSPSKKISKQSKSKKSKRPVKLERGYFKSKDGARIYYEVEGHGRHLVFCYDLLCNMESFRFQRAYFREHHQCIFMDYRGHENSIRHPPSRTNAIEKTIHDLSHLLKHLGHKSAAFIGHSYGVNVTARFGMAYPSQVSAMVWINGLLDNPFGTMFRRQYVDKLISMIKPIYLYYPHHFEAAWRRLVKSSWIPYLLTAPLGFNVMLAHNQDIRNYVEGIARTPYTTFMEVLLQLNKLKDTKRMHKLKQVPVLICAGEKDVVTPHEHQKALIELLPKGEFKTIADARHNAHLERPHYVNKTIHRFLKQHGI